MSESLELVPAEVAPLVQTPRTLDKTWTRLLRGDRGCAFDAMSLIGAVCTIATVSLARMELWPWFPVYISAGTWALGFALGTRAQLRSGRERRLALTEGPLVALGVVDTEVSLQQASPGSKAQVGRALVLLRRDTQSDPGLCRDPKAASEMAKRAKQHLDSDRPNGSELDALIGDRFSFARVVLPGPEFQDWILTRVILQTDRLGQTATPLQAGSVVWAIFHQETDILEQALIG